MQTKWIAIIIIVVVVLFGVSTFNSIKSGNNAVNAAWSNVESLYQTRFDKVPQLVEVVKGSMKHEKETLDMVMQARASANSIKLTPELLKDPEAMKVFEQKQGEFAQALSKLMMLKESYPQLQANAQAGILMHEIAGVENRLNIARQRYNEEVRKYNNSGMTFPGNLFAGIAGFDAKPMFMATQGANQAPQIKF